MTAAAQLLGLTLEDGWLVFERIERSENATGGTFSHSYLAKKGSRTAFVKAFDFSSAFEPGADTLGILNLLTASYEHERDVLEHCRGRRLSKVAVAIGHGHVSVPNMGAMEGRVYYLLFEKADGDIRTQMDVNQASDAFWCMVALRQVCLGLWQIHRQFIAHQDLKPSNVLCYRAWEVRISDFGRSSRPKFLTHRQDNSFIFNHHSRISGCVAWEHPDELEGPLLQRGRLGQSLDARRVRFRGQSALVAGPGPQVRHQRLQALQR